MEAALAAIESLQPGEKPNYTKIAKLFGVDRSTLSRRAQGKQGTRAESAEQKKFLNTTEEKELTKYIYELTKKGLPPTRQMIRNFATEIAGKEPGKNWVERYIARHEIDLVSRWTSGIDACRQRADSATKYALYFKLLGDKITQYDIDSRHIYNMDEKGFLIGILSKMKRVFSRQAYEQGPYKQMLQDGNREWITTIACICADGTALTPALIYQATTGNIQDSWLQDFDPKQHKAFFASSSSGWTNNEVGLAWLQQVFDRETKEKARTAYRLLILDGHGSHVSIKFITYCDKNKILLAIFPPHATHTLQPLDVAMFKPLSTAYSTELSEFMYNCQGLSAITKRDFYRLFNTSWQKAFQESTILKAFECTGLPPYNPDAVLKKFVAEQESALLSRSNSSNLSESDWRKVRQILKEVVAEDFARERNQLSQSYHQLEVKYKILQHQYNQLEQAFFNEKKRRQRGKPLLLDKPDNWYGGAVFYSPAKVQRARERQEQTDAEKKLQQQQLSEAQRQKLQNKQQKQALKEERARVRLAAQELRAQAKEAKAQERAKKLLQKQLEKQLKGDIQLPKKGNRQSLNPRTPHKTTLERPLSTVVDQNCTEEGEPSPAQATRTRTVRLPQRYRK